MTASPCDRPIRLRVNSRIRRPVPTSGPAKAVADIFALRRGGIDEVLYKDFALTFRPGQITAIVGPSGSGKSVLLRLVCQKLTGAGVLELPVERLSRSDVPPVGVLEGTLHQRLDVLSRCGLAEAVVMITPARLLSGGQLYRLALAWALQQALRRGRTTIVAADEFASCLDSVTAQNLCRQLRKLVTGSKVSLLLATPRLELLGALEPDQIVVKPLGAPPRLLGGTAFPGCEATGTSEATGIRQRATGKRQQPQQMAGGTPSPRGGMAAVVCRHVPTNSRSTNNKKRRPRCRYGLEEKRQQQEQTREEQRQTEEEQRQTEEHGRDARGTRGQDALATNSGNPHSAIRDPQSSVHMLPQAATTRKHGTLRALATNSGNPQSAFRNPQFMDGFVVQRGTIQDYRRLALFHYVAGPPAAHKRVYVIRPPAWARDLAAPEVAAVLVVSPPLCCVRGRNLATAGRYLPSSYKNAAASDHPTPPGAGPTSRQCLALLNAEMECISRVIVHPTYRGLGLAVKLVRHALADAETPLMEALAVMGRIHPFFAKAGMTPTGLVRGRQVLYSYYIAHTGRQQPIVDWLWEKEHATTPSAFQRRA